MAGSSTSDHHRRRESQTTNGHSKESAHHIISTDDEEDDEEAAGHVVVASSTSKKRKRTGSSSSERSISTTRSRNGPTKPFSYKKPSSVLKTAKVRKSSTNSAHHRNGSVAEGDDLQRDREKTLEATEEEESEDDSVVVSAARKADAKSRHSSTATASSSRHTISVKPSSRRVEGSDTESVSSRRSVKTNGHASLSRTSSRTSNGQASQPPAHPRVESLTRQESNERASQRKDKGKERERVLGELPNGHARAKPHSPRRSITPEKARHPVSNGHHRSQAGPSSQPVPPGTPSGKEKRLQQQIVQMRLKQEETEDRFNEVSDAMSKWQDRATIAEQEVTRLKRSHNDEISALRKRGDSNGEGVRTAQRLVDEKDNAILQLKAENDRVVIQLRTELAKQRERHALELQAKESAVVANEKDNYEIRTEYEGKMAEAYRLHRREIERLNEQIQYHKTDPKLAAKEREMERIHRQHQKQLDELGMKYNSLKEHYHRERAFWGGSGNQAKGEEDGWSSQVPSRSQPQLPEDVQQLQLQIRTLMKRQNDYPTYIEAQKAAYEGKIRQLLKADAKNTEQSSASLTAIESARASLEMENERFRSKLKNTTEERDKLAEELKFVRNFRAELERLRDQNPLLKTENAELKELRDQLTKENTGLRSERHIYVEKMSKCTADVQANSAELEDLRSYKRKSTQVLQQVRVDKESWKTEKSKARKEQSKLTKRVQKLEKMLRERQAGAIGDDEVDAEHESMDGESDMENDLLDDALGSLNDNRMLSEPLSPRGDDYRMSSAPMQARSPSPVEPPPPVNPFTAALRAKVDARAESTVADLERFEATKPNFRFPATLRERKANTKVPKHRSRVYVRSECHTPYVPEENVSDSDDEFLEWESQAYARSQSRNPDRKEAVVNICWNRHILDARGTRVRSHNLQFCTEFVQSYGQLISSRQGSEALVQHILTLVKLGQLTSDEGCSVVKAYHKAIV